METVLKYDKVILTKELSDKVKKVGDTFEIANILDGSFLLRDARTKVAVGIISFEDFDEHFVPVENFKGWTPWTQFVGFDGHSDVFYRTNRRKTQVKFLTDNVRAESCCHKADDFNLSFGINAAYLRCRNKALAKRKIVLEEALKDINREIADNEKSVKVMVHSLEV